jgi:hypothetical protein
MDAERAGGITPDVLAVTARLTVDGVDAWHGSAPTDALLFTHCGDHGLNLHFQSIVACRPQVHDRSRQQKTDRQRNVGAKTARLMIKPTRAYGISAIEKNCRIRLRCHLNARQAGVLI